MKDIPKDYYDDPHWPTIKKLADYLTSVKAPAHMIDLARSGRYHDFLSEHATPEVDLFVVAKENGMTELMEKIKEGEFDGTPEESKYYFEETPEGREILMELPKKVREDVFGVDW